MKIAEHVDARAKLGREAALELAAKASKVIVAKGNTITTFDMRADPPDDATLLAHVLGPTGNLRAPTVRKGNTLLVGFHEEVYARAFG